MYLIRRNLELRRLEVIEEGASGPIAFIGDQEILDFPHEALAVCELLFRAWLNEMDLGRASAGYCRRVDKDRPGPSSPGL